MTSFEFVVSCGVCHPGGGPLEKDREGKRYDRWMADPRSGLSPGGENRLDGDYHRARWSESGVIEADCLLCHLPSYDRARRNAEIARLNFRWAATAGAGFGKVVGAVKDGQAPRVVYDRSRFQSDGTIVLHTPREPRNATCLGCHAKPGWKKRGDAFLARADVHLAKGMKCVDCHSTGSRAHDPRSRGREVHQIGKGDSPGNFVRDDLDNTVRSCESCHENGTRGAPIARHAWLPPPHLERIACQTCHIPWRLVRTAAVQASDVYNPGPHIQPPGKRIWTFYDSSRRYWNHYGQNTLSKITDQPADPHRPELAWYRGKIYPLNRVHSTFVGYEEKGRTGLGQILMKDYFAMWARHRKDPQKAYPTLAAIRDDDGDGLPEVNRPEEIDALLAGVRAHLAATGFPLSGRRLVWVDGRRAHYSGRRSRPLARTETEASPYASVFKYSHEVAPARAALGARGCTECHAWGVGFFTRPVLVQPFAAGGAPRFAPNHEILGLSGFWVGLGSFREEWLKPTLHLLLAILAVLGAALLARWVLGRWAVLGERAASLVAQVLGVLGIGATLALALAGGDLPGYLVLHRVTLDANPFWVGVISLVVVLAVSLAPGPGGRFHRALRASAWGAVAVAAVSGVLILLRPGGLSGVTRLSYTLFDLAVTAAVLVGCALLAARLMRMPSLNDAAPGALQGEKK